MLIGRGLVDRSPNFGAVGDDPIGLKVNFRNTSGGPPHMPNMVKIYNKVHLAVMCLVP